MTGISAVIITLNEERNIGECIDALKVVADEIIVVDSWSTDHTPQICVAKGVRFYQTTWKGYAETKNWANSFAKYPYILSIDADEVLSEKLQRSILAVKNEPLFDCYRLNRRTNYCGHWMKYLWYPDAKIRLFLKEKARWEGTHVHESLKSCEGSRVGFLNGDLFHYSFRTISQHLATTHKYSSLKATQSHAEGKRSKTVRVIFGPATKFISEYIFKKGFMDGYYGFVACGVSAFGTFIQGVKLHELNQNKPIG